MAVQGSASDILDLDLRRAGMRVIEQFSGAFRQVDKPVV